VLYHWIELWDWFAYLGMTDPLAGLTRDISKLVAVLNPLPLERRKGAQRKRGRSSNLTEPDPPFVE